MNDVDLPASPEPPLARAAENERTVVAADGYRLATTFYPATNAAAVVVINSATAVPRGFYRRFARFLQTCGWHAVTWDYRGIGGSKPRSLRGFDARMRDWALLDMDAVIGSVAEELEPARLFVVGHSFGGQTLGMIGNVDRVDAMVGVSAQSGHWAVQGGREPQKVRFLVTVVMPVLARIFGYFPWTLLGRGEDLPQGVALEWAGWCRNRNYLLDDHTLPLERYERFHAPVLAYSVDDDDWGTSRAVDEMMRAYRNVTRRHLRPADYGLERLGHMGFFRESAEPIWREVVGWLEEVVPATSSRPDPRRRPGPPHS